MLKRVDAGIFLSVAVLVLLALAAAVLDMDAARRGLFALQDGIVEYFAWLFALTATSMLVLAIWLAASRYGGIRLGPPDSTPQFSFFPWLAMLFSAGMGIGL
ncbi:MAG TPA: BCCT family transporter, partial [Pseudomonadaceae bacterium]|nr:BCCT family transporter [Pseudomonadaceae bacterium]